MLEIASHTMAITAVVATVTWLLLLVFAWEAGREEQLGIACLILSLVLWWVGKPDVLIVQLAALAIGIITIAKANAREMRR